MNLRRVLQHIAGAGAIQIEGGRWRDIDGRESVRRCLNIHDHPVVASQRVGHASIHRAREALQGWMLVSHCLESKELLTLRTAFSWHLPVQECQ